MPFDLPALEEVRADNRDFVQGRLASGPLVPNSVARVMADANAGLAYLTLLYVDYLSRQFLPDTAEGPWLERHGQIWGVPRKQASYSAGSASFTGTIGSVVPAGQRLSIASTGGVVAQFETTNDLTIGPTASPVAIQAITPGAVGNLDAGTRLGLTAAISGVDSNTLVVSLTGGADVETDDELRVRVLARIRQTPMGGDASDYVAWALQVAGVTRAWCSPNEMGIGTVTIRIMCDDLRATTNPQTNGFPQYEDLEAVRAHVDTLRPVTVKEFFVCAPIPEPIDFTITNLSNDTTGLRTAIGINVEAMLSDKARPASAENGHPLPAQEIYAAWVSEAILSTPGVDYFDLTMADHPMPNNGCMAVIGSIF